MAEEAEQQMLEASNARQLIRKYAQMVAPLLAKAIAIAANHRRIYAIAVI